MIDKVVEEVHAVRRKIAEECDHDFQKLGDYYKRLQEQDPGPRITEPPKPEPPQEERE